MTRRAGYATLAISMAIFGLCIGLIAWKLVLERARPGGGAAVETHGAPPPPLKVEAFEPSISTIIDLPGDPVTIRRGEMNAPREVRVTLPVKLATVAQKVETVGYYVSSTLVSTDGGYMGKFPEAGQEADALAQQLSMNAAELAGAGDPSIGGEVMDDDGGAATPTNVQDLMLTDANSNKLEINLGARPQLRQVILKTVVADKIGDLLIAHGYSEDSARQTEAAAKASFNVQTLPANSVALAMGAQDPSGAYRVTQLAIYEGKEFVGVVALGENNVYGEGARPTIPPDLLEDSAAGAIGARYDLADGIYSAGLRNSMPEPVIREAIQMLGGVTDLKAPLPADENLRALYARDFRGKSRISGKVIYVGLRGSAGAFDCYSFEGPDGLFRCFDPKQGTAASPPLPPRLNGAPSSLGESGAVSVGGILAPIKGAPVTSLFGMRFHPILHILRLHAGIDFGAPVGSPVRAAADGKVEIAGPVSGFGNHIRIQHQGFETSYSHLSEIPASIKPGAEVKQGEIIALSGNTGLSTGPHLHFEFYLNGTAVDPLPHLGSEVQATAPKSAPGASIPVAVSFGHGGPTEAEVAAFLAAKMQIDAVLEAQAK
jgi:murein DD-endopeptidase MepM/ murein hydrolase activator NlpD